MLPLVLAEFLDDEKILIQFSAIYILATSGLYLFTYLWNRIKLKAPTPLVSALVMIGYFIWLPFLILTAAGLVFHPSLGIIAALYIPDSNKFYLELPITYQYSELTAFL